MLLYLNLYLSQTEHFVLLCIVYNANKVYNFRLTGSSPRILFLKIVEGFVLKFFLHFFICFNYVKILQAIQYNNPCLLEYPDNKIILNTQIMKSLKAKKKKQI